MKKYLKKIKLKHPDELSPSERLHYVLTFLIRISLLLAFFAAAYTNNWLVVFVIISTLFLTFVPSLFERFYKINLPVEFEMVAVIFVYATLFLGEVHGYYVKYWWWDIILHAGAALAMGLLGFTILFVLYKGKKINASPRIVAIFSFCFALAIGALWEIIEFFMDITFELNMQKSGLMDTMGDIIVDAAAALVASVAGYFYIKRGELFILGGIMRRFRKANPWLFKRTIK